MPKELTNLMDGVGPFAAGAANVIMQLSRLPIGRGVAESRVDSGRLDKHPIKRFRTTLMLIGLPIVLLLLFVYVFGGQLGAGLGAHQERHAYLDYVVPALLLITVASAVQGTQSWSPWT
jgi:hypothetical protein